MSPLLHYLFRPAITYAEYGTKKLHFLVVESRMILGSPIEFGIGLLWLSILNPLES